MASVLKVIKGLRCWTIEHGAKTPDLGVTKSWLMSQFDNSELCGPLGKILNFLMSQMLPGKENAGFLPTHRKKVKLIRNKKPHVTLNSHVI